MTADEADIKRERLAWLRCLIVMYRDEHDWKGDEDPEATDEMLRECETLADEYAATIPPPVPPPAQHVCATPEEQEAYDREIPF